MKAMLAKRSHRRSIGLLVGERDVAFSVIGSTPLGRVELARGSEPRQGEPLNDQISRLLGPWLDREPRPRVVLGVPEVRAFHAARELTSTGRKEPEIWLRESLQSAGPRIEEMVFDMIEVGLGKESMAGLVACRKKWMSEALDVLERRSSRLVLVEPTPCALLRAAANDLKAPRRSKLAARFLLGERQAIGMLTAGGVPLHWREFDLPAGEEPLAIHAALMVLRMQVKSWQAEAKIDSVIIQGRPELGPKLSPAEFGRRTGMKVTRADSPGYDPGSICRGLALGGLVEEKGFDLSKNLKPLEPIAEVFPWGDLVMQASMLLGIVRLVSE